MSNFVVVHDRIYGFGSVSVIFSGLGGYSVSVEYLKDLTETEHLYLLTNLMF